MIVPIFSEYFGGSRLNRMEVILRKHNNAKRSLVEANRELIVWPQSRPSWRRYGVKRRFFESGLFILETNITNMGGRLSP